MMSNAKYNNTLYLLDLGSNNIGDHGVEFITNWLVKRPVLKTLILCRNIITNHGARSLSFILPFSRILVLDISYNKITNDGMVDILNTLKKSPLLQQLKIFGNCISHPTAKVLIILIKSIRNAIYVLQLFIDHQTDVDFPNPRTRENRCQTLQS